MDLVEKRQDLNLQYIERLARLGRLSDAASLLKNGTFYTYEGGEGLVPAMHAFVNIRLGMQALETEENEKALEYFKYASSSPEQFHEGYKYQEKLAYLHYYLALGYEAVGDQEAMLKELKNAAEQYDNEGESQYFKGLALRKLGDIEAADQLFTRLKERAEEILKNQTLQFFLSFPAALLFEQSQRRTIEKMGYTALFYGQLGAGEFEKAKETAVLMRSKGISSYWIEYLLAS